MYIFERLLQKEELQALRGSRRDCPHLSSADHEGSGTNCIGDLCAGSGTNVIQGTKTTVFPEKEYHVNAK